MIDTDTPEIRAARAADPAWQAEMRRHSEAASQRFADYRRSVGMPLVRKKDGERF
jgi:hypothetical protein